MHDVFVHYSAPLLCAQSKEKKYKSVFSGKWSFRDERTCTEISAFVSRQPVLRALTLEERSCIKMPQSKIKELICREVDPTEAQVRHFSARQQKEKKKVCCCVFSSSSGFVPRHHLPHISSHCRHEQLCHALGRPHVFPVSEWNPSLLISRRWSILATHPWPLHLCSNDLSSLGTAGICNVCAAGGRLISVVCTFCKARCKNHPWCITQLSGSQHPLTLSSRIDTYRRWNHPVRWRRRSSAVAAFQRRLINLDAFQRHRDCGSSSTQALGRERVGLGRRPSPLSVSPHPC